MRNGSLSWILILLLVLPFSCKEPELLPDPDPNATISLDELEDMNEYGEGMVVDSRMYGSRRVSKISLNHKDHKDPVSLDLSMAGYYHLEIYTEGRRPDPEIIRLVILDPERGLTEWGLPPWTPEGLEFTEPGAQTIHVIHPPIIPSGQDFPLVVTVDGPPGFSLDNFLASTGGNTFSIKRGSGAYWVQSSSMPGSTIQIGSRTFPVVAEIFGNAPQQVSGHLSENLVFAPSSFIHITDDLSIPSGMSLLIGEGSYISIDPGVNIHNQGKLTIRGSETNPVTLTCSDEEDYWGGIIGSGSGNLVEAEHAIFCRSGYHTGSDYNWGHAHRQALFYCNAGSIDLDQCYMFDHIGQVFFTQYAQIQLNACLVLKAKTGGQLEYTNLNMDHVVFSDFPNEETDYMDNDNDALYLVECEGVIDHSIFMFARDDGLDSGSGGEGGHVTVRNSRFESIFHEGAALSGGKGSTSKVHKFHNCVFRDCGQGLELGFSNRAHLVTVDSCTFERNGIGIRYGDNYDWGIKGTLLVSNSYSVHNRAYDVWNMDRSDWIADTASMVFDNVWVSKENPMYPQLKLIE